MRKKILPVLILTTFQLGCAEQYVYQDPAPVYRSHPAVLARETPKTVETYKYPEEPDAQLLPKMEEVIANEPSPVAPSEPVPAPVVAPELVQTPDTVAPVVPPVVAPEIPVVPPISTASFSPAILALATEADQNAQSGQYESAGVKMERALRIDPRNAVLAYKLAVIRLKQEQPRLAEDLAKKAALLAGSDRDIKKRSWLLIAESKRLQKDMDGAQKAEEKAAQF